MMIETLDVRQLTPRERHPVIFSKLETLAVGDTLRLVNDHDPKPLRYQLLAEHAGQFEWAPEEQGPEQWIVRIQRVAPAAAEIAPRTGKGGLS